MTRHRLCAGMYGDGRRAAHITRSLGSAVLWAMGDIPPGKIIIHLFHLRLSAICFFTLFNTPLKPIED
jgi:hypothetical protein